MLSYDNGEGNSLVSLDRLKSAGYPYRLLMVEDSGFRLGIIKPLNTLLRAALEDSECRYILMCSNDHHVITPDWLRLLVWKAKSDPTLGCISPLQLNDHVSCGKWSQTGFLVPQSDPNDPFWETWEHEYVDISRGFCLMPASLLREIGLFDEGFGTGAYENYDMWNRMKYAHPEMKSSSWGKVKYTHCVHGNKIEIKDPNTPAAQGEWNQKAGGEYYIRKWEQGPGAHPRKPNFEGQIW